MADISQIVLKDSSGNVIGTYNVKDATVPHTSEAAASGGTTLSLVTTGEKATWNAKSNLQLGTTSTTALKGDTKYAGSSSAGGSATSAVKLDTATAGSATQPCYFTGGKPSACTHSLNKTVPSDAKFTDTTYTLGTSGNSVRLSANGTAQNDITVPYSTKAATWNTARNLTIGNTAKSVDGSAAVSWPNPLKFAGYGSDSANTSGWYKVMTVSQSGYSDINLNLLITSGYSKNASGILHLHVRCNNGTANSIQTLAWLTRIGWSAGDVYYKDHGNNTWSLYVYQANTQYGRVQVQILTEVGTTTNQQNITLNSSTTRESSTPTGGTASWDGATVNNANYLGGSITASYLNCLQKYTGGDSTSFVVYLDAAYWTCGILIANINNWGNGAWYYSITSDTIGTAYAFNGSSSPPFRASKPATNRISFDCVTGYSFRRCTWLGLL